MMNRPSLSRSPGRLSPRPPLAILGLVALAVFFSSCRDSRDSEADTAALWSGEAPRHVILLSVDTWREDHFLAERGGVALTPNLARLARRSVQFAANSSVATETSPGVAGLLTGLLPFRSGVLINDHVLAPEVPTLATSLDEAGFTTAAFVANPVLKRGTGFEKGFDLYEHVKSHPSRWKTRAAEVQVPALAWLDERDPGERIFLWIHYMEPHGPYEPPEEDLRRFPAEAFDASTDLELLPKGVNNGRDGVPHYQQVGEGVATSDGREYLRRYAAEVHSLDAEIGRFLDALDERGLLGESLIVVGADHGEALIDDHGFYFSHGHGLTDDQLQVPLLFALPGIERGNVVETATSNVDLLPTVLGVLGLDPPVESDGVDLLTGELPDRAASATWTERALRRGAWKLRIRGGKDRGVTLVHLERDPEEKRNLAERNPEVFRELNSALRQILAQPRLAEPRKRGALTPEEEEKLRALGYL